jgi:peroxiredoxin
MLLFLTNKIMRNLILLFVGLSWSLHAQNVPNFSLVNAADGKPITLQDYSKAQAVLLIFTSNACPYDNYYLDRIKSLQQTYQAQLPILLINAHVDEAESIAAMKAFANKNNLSIPYLADKDQVVMTILKARKSPEVFLLQNNKGQFSVVYRGAIDDNAQSASEVRNTFLKNSIDQLLTGKKPATQEERPVGCSIRKK